MEDNMHEERCSHTWEMVDVIPCFIVTEKCYHCGKIATYFSTENIPPIEEYREGEHLWNFMGSAQSIKFNLKCIKCDKLEKFDELLGVMMCTGCDEKCEANVLLKKLEQKRIWIYVAFGYLPIDEKKQLSLKQISILEDYFNQRRKSSKSRIKIVSHKLVNNIASCYAEVIKDVDMLSLTLPEK